jgi:hypothetical protein
MATIDELLKEEEYAPFPVVISVTVDDPPEDIGLEWHTVHDMVTDIIGPEAIREFIMDRVYRLLASDIRDLVEVEVW